MAILAGNRTGKSVAGAALVTACTTGQYPPGWEGRRFPGPTEWWVAGKTFEATRDVPQKILLGKELAQAGSGMLPASTLGRITRRSGVPDAVDGISVKHTSGGWSHIQFKAYEQDVTKFRGASLHGIWVDEEPPADIYGESLARLTERSGVMVLTLTPLEGMTEVVRYFWPEPTTPDRFLVRAELETCGLYSPRQVARRVASWAPHEREARSRGIPMLGTGPVWPIAESALVVPDFEVPRSWPRISALDFGLGDHPTAAVQLALQMDRGNVERVFVVRDYRQKEPNPLLNAGALKSWGQYPVAWPHDGNHIGDSKSMQPLSAIYRGHGLWMLPEHATFAGGGIGVDAGLKEIFEWMQTGRWKVFQSCQCWLEEFRQYHRKDGKLVKVYDDVLSASRYAFMMRRFARGEPDADRLRKPLLPPRWDVFEMLEQETPFERESR